MMMTTIMMMIMIMMMMMMMMAMMMDHLGKLGLDDPGSNGVHPDVVHCHLTKIMMIIIL